jgi:hypothetical protein
LKDVQFKPGNLTHSGDKDTLTLKAADPKAAAALPVSLRTTAHVLLKDGRAMELQNTVSGHRPQVMLASKSVETAPDASNLVHLVDPNELPVGSKVTFVLKTVAIPGFSRSDKVEVQSEDQTLHTTLEVSDGGLVLQDSSTMLGSFDPLKSFGPSAFGKLQLRATDASGAPGDWIPLGTLVRVPVIASVKCARATRAAAAAAAVAATRAADASDAPATTAAPPPPVNDTTPPPANDPTAQCTLNGTSLFLIDSISSDPQFTHSVSVPDGYTNPTLAVPRPSSGELYLHLRDDPAIANTITVPANAATLSRTNATGGVSAAAAIARPPIDDSNR